MVLNGRFVSSVGVMIAAIGSACAQPAGAPSLGGGGAPSPSGANNGSSSAVTPGPGARKPGEASVHPGITRCAKESDFLAYHDLPCAQSGGLPLPGANSALLEHNKELVLRFYQGDTSVIADQFIQHDPAEPSTRTAWLKFFQYRMRTAGSQKKPDLGGPMGYGKVPVDASGSPVEYLVAEGDMVIAMRFRWWPWENGPEPIYKGLFVDVWRVSHDQLVEQWCSATPEDATASGIALAKQEGAWVKFKNMNEQ